MGACAFSGVQIFKNLRFYPSRRVQQSGVFKNLHRRGAFLKRCVFGDGLHRVREDGRFCLREVINWGRTLVIFPVGESVGGGTEALFTLYWRGFSPPRKPCLIRLLFTHKNGDFGAVSVTKRSCAAPVSKVESHISDRHPL